MFFVSVKSLAIRVVCARNVVSLFSRRLCVATTTPPDDSLPSGWKPPSDGTIKVPFQVRRSRTNNLPVYLDYKNGRARIFTIIRNIEGDIMTLETMLRSHLKAHKVESRVDNNTKQIVLNGNYRNETKLFLRSLGF